MALSARVANCFYIFLLRTLELTFDTQELLKLCIDEMRADEALGTRAAEALRNRLSDIRAADSMLDLLAGRPTQSLYGDQTSYRIELSEGMCLIIVPNHNKPRLDASGAPDWSRVRRVRVLAVEQLR